MRFRDALEDVALSAARPELVAAPDAADRQVRWVHASEQLDIAPLLRGGELILMEGVNFAHCTAAELAIYLDSLWSADVAGLAIETTDRVPTIPSAILVHADAIGLPVVRLRRRVPFVQICESINSHLSAPALRRLHLADRMSRMLSAASDADDAVSEVMTILARETKSSVVLRSTSGDEIGRIGFGTPRGDLTDFDAPISFAGRRLGTVVLVPEPESDIHLLDTGLERAPSALAFALMEAGRAAEDRSITRFFALLTADSQLVPDVPAQLEVVAEKLGLSKPYAYLSMVCTVGTSSPPTDPVQIGAARVLSHDFGDQRLIVLAFEDRDGLELTRSELLAKPSIEGITALGPGATGLHELRRCVAAARSTHSLNADGRSSALLDARNYAVPRLLDALPAESVAAAFVDEQIGAVLSHDRERRGLLFDTLAAYLTHWGSKTDTANALGIRRQTLYKRMDRLEAVLGPLPPGSPRIPAVATAVFLEQARRQRLGREKVGAPEPAQVVVSHTVRQV